MRNLSQSTIWNMYVKAAKEYGLALFIGIMAVQVVGKEESGLFNHATVII